MQLVDVHSRIYSSLLSSRYSFQQLWDQDISLIEDMNFYSILMSDAGFGAIIRVFYAEVAASGIMCAPGNRDEKSAQKARIVASILKRAPVQECIYGLAKGFIMGRAYAYPEGRGVMAAHDNTPPQSWWTPVDIKDLDKQRVILVPEKYDVPDPEAPDRTIQRIRVHRELSDPANGGAYRRMTRESAAALIEFVCGDEEERLGMGRGLAEALYMLLRAKALLWKFRLQGISRWAEGVLIGTVDPDRPASPSKSNLSLAQDLLSKLRNMRDGNVIVVPEGLADVKALESNGTGDDMTSAAMDYCDDCAARLLLGSIMPTGGNKGSGTEARGRVEADTTKRVIQWSRHLICACLNRTLIRTVCRLNREQFLEVGCLEGEDPLLKIIDNQATDPETVLKRIETAQKLQMQVPEEWAHEVAEIPMPSPGEPVLKPMPVAGLTGLGGSGDQSGLNDGKEDPGGNGTPFEKTGERKDEKKKGEDYAARRDAEIRELIAVYDARIDRLEQSMSERGQVVVNVPAHPDVAAAQEREALLKAQIADQQAQYAAEKDRPIIVNVAAPKVDVKVEPPPPADVTLNPTFNVAAPNVTVTPQIAVESARVQEVHVVNAERRREIMIKRNGDGKITGAEVVEKTA